jgi:Magnesium chelatase, subunit ChlI
VDPPLIQYRPFRAPHPAITNAGPGQGGHVPRPEEISLAHRGVLSLDEMPEFGRHTLEDPCSARGIQHQTGRLSNRAGIEQVARGRLHSALVTECRHPTFTDHSPQIWAKVAPPTDLCHSAGTFEASLRPNWLMRPGK